jgi:hypothetical protein
MNGMLAPCLAATCRILIPVHDGLGPPIAGQWQGKAAPATRRTLLDALGTPPSGRTYQGIDARRHHLLVGRRGGPRLWLRLWQQPGIALLLERPLAARPLPRLAQRTVRARRRVRVAIWRLASGLFARLGLASVRRLASALSVRRLASALVRRLALIPVCLSVCGSAVVGAARGTSLRLHPSIPIRRCRVGRRSVRTRRTSAVGERSAPQWRRVAFAGRILCFARRAFRPLSLLCGLQLRLAL